MDRRPPTNVGEAGPTVASVASQFHCGGTWAEVSPGVGECDRGLDCEALELLDDFDAYRLAHERHSDRPASR